MMKNVKLKNPIFPVAILLVLLFGQCEKPYNKMERVVLIGIDGMSVSAFQKAQLPHLHQLVRQGALSLDTRVVMPSVSAPNWASHLMGAGPEQHGITANGWSANNAVLPPAAADEEGYFPSLFTLLREQQPESSTALFYDWNALADLFNPADIDHSVYSRTFEGSITKAISWIPDNNPLFTFLYIGHPDETGHKYGWESKEYIKALEDVDAAIGKFFDGLKAVGMMENTTFLVVTDHGGTGKGHGGLTLLEMEVPWIIAGPGVIKDRMIEQPNNVTNTAATIAFLLDLDIPLVWTGRPAYGALVGHPLTDSNKNAYVPQPFSSVSGGLYYESPAVELTVKEAVPIRFTLDGSDPDIASMPYKTPVLVQKTAVFKAAAFRDESRSRVTEVEIIKVLEPVKVSISHDPAEEYSGKGPYTIVDRQFGSVDIKDGKWLGFRGNDPEIAIQLKQHSNVSRIAIGLLSDPYYWIFPPREIAVLASIDGVKYSPIGNLNEETIQNKIKKGINRLEVPIQAAKTKYLKIVFTGPGVCPPDHPGEGEDAWLFIDEILVE
jgi:hypothetical protein